MAHHPPPSNLPFPFSTWMGDGFTGCMQISQNKKQDPNGSNKLQIGNKHVLKGVFWVLHNRGVCMHATNP